MELEEVLKEIRERGLSVFFAVDEIDRIFDTNNFRNQPKQKKNFLLQLKALMEEENVMLVVSGSSSVLYEILCGDF